MSTHSKCCLLTELNNRKTSFIDLKKKKYFCFCLHQQLWLLPTLAKRHIFDGIWTKKSVIWMSICNLINNFSKHGIPIYFDGKQSPRNENVNYARRWRRSTIARLARIQRHWRQQWQRCKQVEWKKSTNKSLCSCCELTEHESTSVLFKANRSTKDL